MITDAQTNTLYLADCLPDLQPTFFSRLENILQECKINFQFLPSCKDIWAVDFMPVQVTKDKFIQFVYNPDYLQGSRWAETISDVYTICRTIGLAPFKSKLLIDGGNVVRAVDRVIMCDKVFSENRHLSKKEVVQQLEELFQVDKLIFVPWDRNDFTGHADGMVRFMDRDTVIVNDYGREKPAFRDAFHKALQNAGLRTITFPYNPYSNRTKDAANGIYINYLQMKDVIVVPTYGMKEDDETTK